MYQIVACRLNCPMHPHHINVLLNLATLSSVKHNHILNNYIHSSQSGVSVNHCQHVSINAVINHFSWINSHQEKQTQNEYASGWGEGV